MKKLLCILMVCLLALTLCAPALAEESEPLVGGWTPTEGDPTQIPTEDLEGCTYTPVALLAAQVVAGTNYCLLCQTQIVTPDAPIGYALVYFYEALDGSAHLQKVQEIEFCAFETLD